MKNYGKVECAHNLYSEVLKLIIEDGVYQKKLINNFQRIDHVLFSRKTPNNFLIKINVHRAFENVKDATITN